MTGQAAAYISHVSQDEDSTTSFDLRYHSLDPSIAGVSVILLFNSFPDSSDSDSSSDTSSDSSIIEILPPGSLNWTSVPSHPEPGILMTCDK